MASAKLLYDNSGSPRVDAHRYGLAQLEEIRDSDTAAIVELRKQIQSCDHGGQIPSEDIFKLRADASPNVAECATHLKFLEALFVLRQNITTSDVMCRAASLEYNAGRISFIDPESCGSWLWGNFVDFATVRFLVWWEAINKQLGEDPRPLGPEDLPPLDVLMSWHAFLLMPERIRDHCQHDPLYHFTFPWQAIHQSIDTSTLNFNHDRLAASNFTSLTGLEPDLFVELVDWAKNGGIYAGQMRFSLQDFALGSDGPDPPKVLFGRQPSVGPGKLTESAAKYFKLFGSIDEDIGRHIREEALRQGAFTSKMNERAWLRSPSLESTIRRAMSRYENFCVLLKENRKEVLVPTVDIDLAWHTHQLTGSSYAEDMEKSVGRFINHDSDMGKLPLRDGAEKTRLLWHVRFGSEYVACGCWNCETMLSEIEKIDDSDEGVDMQKIAKRVDDMLIEYRAAEFLRTQSKL